MLFLGVLSGRVKKPQSGLGAAPAASASADLQRSGPEDGLPPMLAR